MRGIYNTKTWIGVLILISVEQIIKIIIKNNYLFEEAPILPPFLYFRPMFNRDYSWFNSMLQLGVSKWLHIVIVGIMIIFIFLFYQFLNHRTGRSRMINAIFIFVFSGAMCSLLDKVFWDGSLDYIMLKGFFTFDLKDVYVNVSIGLLFLLLIRKDKALKQMEDKNIIRDFTKFILRKL